MGDLVFEATGHNGTVKLYSDRVVINHKSVMGFLTTGAPGEKTVPIDLITSVDFKESSFLR